MSDLFEQIVNELTVAQQNAHQRDVTKLHPKYPARVQNVKALGGIRLSEVKPNVWHFKVHSGDPKKGDYWYDDYIEWKSVPELLKQLVPNKKYWTVDGKHCDLRKLAKAFFYDVEVRTSCSCPSDIYSGFHYIRSQPEKDAKYGAPENRPPNIRNPNRYGFHCKHLGALFQAIPWYMTDYAQWLKNTYNDQIKAIEQSVGGGGTTKPTRPVKPAKAKVEPEVEEPAIEQPEKQEPEVKTPLQPVQKAPPQSGRIVVPKKGVTPMVKQTKPEDEVDKTRPDYIEPKGKEPETQAPVKKAPQPTFLKPRTKSVPKKSTIVPKKGTKPLPKPKRGNI